MQKISDKLRCYHFGNFYFSGIHAGIQSHHASMEIFNKHNRSDNSTQSKYLYDWSENHKTVIILNAGMHFNLLDFEKFMEKEENPYPWASFREAEMATNSTLTNVGVVLPEEIFKMSRLVVNNHPKVLKNRGIGDGINFDGNGLIIEVVDGGVMVNYKPQDPAFSLIKPLIENPVEVFTGVVNKFYSDFEVELMARMSLCSLMS